MDKRTKQLLKTLEAQGARIERSKNGFIIYPPDKSKPQVSIHLTYSDRRSEKNERAQLRRSGFDV
ncbi:MAG: hypothetical protein ACTH6N_05785 [Brachybacterium tyrofermentans]|uniref:hypothetical protein n=1 Tax=Brachybacterium tyrofermentans TaxID=47848 RepID=UPI001D0183C4|nr:hypothetical protein [Brachybacterium tyrofermentans]